MIRKLKKILDDTRSVDIDDAYALDFWTKEFGVTQKRLKAAVLVAGSEAMMVRRELNKPKVVSNK